MPVVYTGVQGDSQQENAVDRPPEHPHAPRFRAGLRQNHSRQYPESTTTDMKTLDYQYQRQPLFPFEEIE